MCSLEEFKVHIRHPDVGEGVVECFGSQVEVELVASASVDVDGLHGFEGIGVLRNHANRIPREPSRPDVGEQFARLRVVGQVNRTIGIGGVTRGHAVVVEQTGIAVACEGDAAMKIFPEVVEGATLVVTQSTHGMAKFGEIAGLEECVTCVCRQSTPQVRA